MATKDEIKALLTEKGIAFDEDMSKKELEALVPADAAPAAADEPSEDVADEAEVSPVDVALAKLNSVGLPDGCFHLINIVDGDVAKCFVLNDKGQRVTHATENEEERKRFVKMVHRCNQLNPEISKLVKNRQEATSKAGKEYRVQVEFSL